MSLFNGKVIAITGGGQGIGLATAELLASRGGTICLGDQNASTLEIAIAKLATYQNQKHSKTVVDVRNSEQVNKWVKDIVAEYGHLDGAVNLAGVLRPGVALKDETDENWAFSMDVNARGVFFCIRAQVNAMTKGGSIVSASSVLGLRATASCALYSASKFAVCGLTRAAARENPHLRINAVAPSFTQTPMVADMRAQFGDLMTHDQVMNRFADPREIASVIAFLLSDEASFVTGAIYPVDGGNMA